MFKTVKLYSNILLKLFLIKVVTVLQLPFLCFPNPSCDLHSQPPLNPPLLSLKWMAFLIYCFSATEVHRIS